MKRAVNKLLFGSVDIKEFICIGSREEDIKEKVYLKAEYLFLDISERQWLLCLEPMIFGVWITDQYQRSILKQSQFYKLLITTSEDEKTTGGCFVELSLDFFSAIEEDDGMLFLLKVVSSKTFFTDYIRTLSVTARFALKPEQTFLNARYLSGAYAYPRKVYLVSFRQGNYYNFFPMDLLGEVSANDRFVFGLRHTNKSLAGILETRKLVLCEVCAEHKNYLFDLGKHHSSDPPVIDQLPYSVIRTERYEFFVPEWVKGYREISIIKTMNLGRQMLLWGKMEHRVDPINSEKLYHIHFLRFLSRKGDFTYALA